MHFYIKPLNRQLPEFHREQRIEYSSLEIYFVFIHGLFFVKKSKENNDTRTAQRLGGQGSNYFALYIFLYIYNLSSGVLFYKNDTHAIFLLWGAVIGQFAYSNTIRNHVRWHMLTDNKINNSIINNNNSKKEHFLWVQHVNPTHHNHDNNNHNSLTSTSTLSKALASVQTYGTSVQPLPHRCPQ